MKLKQMSTQLIKLVQFDHIPFIELLTGNISEFGKQLDFAEIKIDGRRVEFQLGTFIHEGKQIPIYKIELEDRKCVIHIKGSSSDADNLYLYLKNMLLKLTETQISIDDFMPEIVSVSESEIVVDLDFSYNQIFAPGLMQFFQNDFLNSIDKSLGTPSLFMEMLIMKIAYSTVDERLGEYQINLNPKEILLGPRPGTLSSDKVYLLKGPVRTDVLIELAEKLEKTFSG